MKLHPLLGSSANPDKLSATITGVALSLVPIVIMLLGHADIDITPESLVDMINSVAFAATAAYAAFGAVRKILKKL